MAVVQAVGLVEVARRLVSRALELVELGRKLLVPESEWGSRKEACSQLRACCNNKRYKRFTK